MAKPEVTPISGRSCGTCSLCCKVIAVKMLNKPMGKRCAHQGLRGCTIYADRPLECRSFSCAWLLGQVPGKYKPSRIRAVVHGSTLRSPNGKTVVKVLKITADSDRSLHTRTVELLKDASKRVPCVLEWDGNIYVWQQGSCVLSLTQGQSFRFEVNEKGQFTELEIVAPDAIDPDDVMSEEPAYVDTRYVNGSLTSPTMRRNDD